MNSKSDNVQPVPRPQRTTVKLLQYTPLVSCLLRQALSNYNWTGIIAAIDCGKDDIDVIYNDLIKVLKWHINAIVLTRNVSMRERHPSYITPRIKILLRKRNKLR